MAQHNEVDFERELCEHLAESGWLYSPDHSGYDAQRALFPEDVLGWLEDTQPDELAKRIKPSMAPAAQEKAREALLNRLAKVLDTGAPSGGTLHILRNGFKDVPASFQMMQPLPAMSGNRTAEARYAANRLRVMRQVHYSVKEPRKSIDLVLFLNGIPVATAELKTDFTQSVTHAKRQYMTDRKPAGEPLLGFGTRALVHFAVSNDEVWMTTRLAGTETHFLPFNQGNDGAAGNPPRPGTSPSAYLWEEVWQRDRWLDILSKLMVHERTEHRDPETRKRVVKEAIIFPRYHQLDAVTKLLADVREAGPGQRYLIQHSAGSGKTRTIAWTAHRLATLHDAGNRKVFDTVIVVTDRNVLDGQLQDAVRQIESQPGFVAAINQREAAKRSLSSKSAYLTQELSAGKPIIVVTLQTFPFVLAAIQENHALADRRFAVIADEAHSSQTGQAAAKLKQVLTDHELEELADGGEVDVETILAAESRSRAETSNISFFAFTATPKNKTMELFGTPDENELPRPFHVYTMQQAIEEGFILDVLENYTSYKTAFELARKVSNGEMAPLAKTDDEGNKVDEAAATKGLMRWVRLHPTNIAQKVNIIVEHFDANVKDLLGGTAKAMVVTDSRKAAVKYKRAMDDYIAKHQLSEVTSLVAFSGKVQFEPQDIEPGDLVNHIDEYTETSMNPGAGDLRAAFDTAEYRVMIVANKFQTGFDQPKLCAMYVDKQLSGVTAVQTLSRLNRAVPGKQTVILDFVNDPQIILKSFQQYYTAASMEQTTDPNLIHDLGNKLDTSGVYTLDEVEQTAALAVANAGNNKLAGILTPVKQRFIAAYNAAVASGDTARRDELDTFRKDVSSYVKLFDFLSQIVDLGDTDVEKHAIFFRHLAKQIRKQDTTPEIDLSEVELVQIVQKDKGQHKLDLSTGETLPLSPITGVGSGKPRDPNLVVLDEIIDKLNEYFAGEDFRDDQTRSWINSTVDALKVDPDLVEQAKANSKAQFLVSPTLRDSVLLAMAETRDAHNRMADIVYTNDDLEIYLTKSLGELLYRDLHPLEGVAAN